MKCEVVSFSAYTDSANDTFPVQDQGSLTCQENGNLKNYKIQVHENKTDFVIQV